MRATYSQYNTTLASLADSCARNIERRQLRRKSVTTSARASHRFLQMAAVQVAGMR